MPRVQNKRGTAANLASVDPTPLAGELIWESDTNRLKVGNGSSAYTSLAYVGANSPTFTGVVAVAAGTAALPAITVTGDTDTGLSFPAANIIAVSTNGLERLRVNGAGNLMVGAPGNWATGTTAQAAVEIRRSSATLYSSAGSNLGGAANAALTVRNVSSTAGSWAALVLEGQRDDGERQSVSIGAVTHNDSLYQPHLVFNHRTSSGGITERMRIANGGNVGIATQTPESRLHVAGVITVSAGTAALPALVPSGDANTGILFPAADTVAISTAGSERVRIDSSGNVGVHTTSPTAKLDISGNTMRLRTARTPASAGATGNAGDICWDADYLYICTATNTWRRIAHSTW